MGKQDFKIKENNKIAGQHKAVNLRLLDYHIHNTTHSNLQSSYLQRNLVYILFS